MTFVSQRSREESIASYLLYMWQVEDTLRALDFDPDRIRRYVAEGYRCTPEEQSRVVQWYLALAEEMKQEGIVTGGHLRRLREQVTTLEQLASRLLKTPSETLFATLYYAALPAIVQLRDKGGEGAKAQGEVETALTGLYGYVTLRERGEEVSLSTFEAMKQLAAFLNILSDRFRLLEEGRLELESTDRPS